MRGRSLERRASAKCWSLLRLREGLERLPESEVSLIKSARSRHSSLTCVQRKSFLKILASLLNRFSLARHAARERGRNVPFSFLSDDSVEQHGRNIWDGAEKENSRSVRSNNVPHVSDISCTVSPKNSSFQKRLRFVIARNPARTRGVTKQSPRMSSPRKRGPDSRVRGNDKDSDDEEIASLRLQRRSLTAFEEWYKVSSRVLFTVSQKGALNT